MSAGHGGDGSQTCEHDLDPETPRVVACRFHALRFHGLRPTVTGRSPDGAHGFDCEAALRADGRGARAHTGSPVLIQASYLRRLRNACEKSCNWDASCSRKTRNSSKFVIRNAKTARASGGRVGRGMKKLPGGGESGGCQGGVLNSRNRGGPMGDRRRLCLTAHSLTVNY